MTKFEILKVEATFIDPNREELNEGIDNEEIELEKLEMLQDKLDKIEAGDNNNFTVDLYRALNALNTSHDKSVEAFNKDIHKKLNHRSIWDFVIAAVICLVLTIIFMMAIVINKVFRKQKKTIKDLMENTVTKIELVNNSTKFDDFFRTLDKDAQMTLLIGAEVMKRDDGMLFNKMLEVAKEMKISLTLEDMPKVLLEYFDMRTTREALDHINEMGRHYSQLPGGGRCRGRHRRTLECVSKNLSPTSTFD